MTLGAYIALALGGGYNLFLPLFPEGSNHEFLDFIQGLFVVCVVVIICTYMIVTRLDKFKKEKADEKDEPHAEEHSGDD